MDIDRQKQT